MGFPIEPTLPISAPKVTELRPAQADELKLQAQRKDEGTTTDVTTSSADLPPAAMHEARVRGVEDAARSANDSLSLLQSSRESLAEIEETLDAIEDSQKANIATLDSSAPPKVPTSIRESEPEIKDARDQVAQLKDSLSRLEDHLASTTEQLQDRLSVFSDAKTRIVSFSMADEATEVTRDDMLREASLAFLAQANSEPDKVMSLLADE